MTRPLASAPPRLRPSRRRRLPGLAVPAIALAALSVTGVAQLALLPAGEAAAAPSARSAGAATAASPSPANVPATASPVTASPVTVNYTCQVPVLGSETYSGTASGTVPASVDPGAHLSVTGYQATLTLPGSLTTDMQAVGVPNPLQGQVTEEDVGATQATPANQNAASPPLNVSVPYTAGQPATVVPPPTTVGPFTAGSSGPVQLSSGTFTFTGNFGATLGTQTITCIPQAPVTPFAAVTVNAGSLSITTTSPLPSSHVGLAYSFTLQTSGGVPPFAWSLSSGALPQGLVLDPSTGVISGTPQSKGTATFTAAVTDSSSPPRHAVSAPLRLDVGAPVALPDLYEWGITGAPRSVNVVQHRTPTRRAIPPGVRFVRVTAGDAFSLGLTSTGGVYAWGENGDGELGNGSTTDSSAPVAVGLPAGTDVVAVAAGGFHTLALTSTDTLYAWGANYYGQLGNGTTSTSATPVLVSLPAGVKITAVAAGGSFSLARASNGALYAWGDNVDGELGNGGTTSRATPVRVMLPGGAGVSQVAAGASSSYALSATGTLYAWGYNGHGQLGDGTRSERLRPRPVALPPGTTVASISAEAADGLAVSTGRTVFSWGYGRTGELGNGATGDHLRPVTVQLPAGTDARVVVGGRDHALVRTAAGALLAWGDNYWGQLGNGTMRNHRLSPVPVLLPPGATAIAVGSGSLSDASLALVRTKR